MQKRCGLRLDLLRRSPSQKTRHLQPPVISVGGGQGQRLDTRTPKEPSFTLLLGVSLPSSFSHAPKAEENVTEGFLKLTEKGEGISTGPIACSRGGCTRAAPSRGLSPE